MSDKSSNQNIQTFDNKAEIANILKVFDISDAGLKEIKASLAAEYELGLRDEDSATVKMLITYVREMSRGDENGTYLALDLGGTNFRVLLVSIDSGRETQISSVSHSVPAELLVCQDGRKLFDYIGLKLLEFVQLKKLKGRRISLGFTFSFPCKQYGLTQSILVKWCKGYNVGGVIGTDVVRQLKDALKRQLSGLIEAYIDVVAVINDTTGTLVACANSRKDCRIGLIVGTGYNACYIERLDMCEKWPANYTNPKHVIINCEWGAMGDHKDRRELDKFRNEFDEHIDKYSINPRNQTYEKMVSGMYIGEMLRLVLLKLISMGLIFEKNKQQDLIEQNPSVSKTIKQDNDKDQTKSANDFNQNHKLNTKDILHGKHMSMLAQDEMSGKLDNSRKLMKELCIEEFNDNDLRIVIQVASKIMHRSAHLVAAGISSLLERIKKPTTSIGYDGSVIRFHPYFLQKVVNKCKQITNQDYKFDFVLSSDGSGIGAAVVAAALHKERRPLYILKPGKLYEMHFSRNNQQQDSLNSSPRQ